MQCRNCGAQIADKAIVCYRCGTGTTEPVRKAAVIAPSRNRLIPGVVAAILVLAGLYLLNLSRTAANPEWQQLAAGLAIGGAVAVLLLFVLRRR
jgi:hypothetical protein